MRCIFLRLDELDNRVQAFRERYDPQARLIEPHITLVFPFEGDFSDSTLKDHAGAVASCIHPFSVSCGPPTVHEEHLFLPVRCGNDLVCELHDRLYSGPLKSFLLDIPYIPHITIGKGAPAELDKMRIRAEALPIEQRIPISTMMLERIGESGQSIPIDELALGKRPI